MAYERAKHFFGDILSDEEIEEAMNITDEEADELDRECDKALGSFFDTWGENEERIAK